MSSKTKKKATTTKGNAKATKPTATARGAKPKGDAKPKPLSCLDAAAAVLKASGEPMQVRAMVEQMRAKGLWQSDAPTPWATLYSAIIREVTKKGGASRFKKTDRGHFTLNA
jgi:hypothetical protein